MDISFWWNRDLNVKIEIRLVEENLGGFYIFLNEKGIFKILKDLIIYKILKKSER